MPSALAAAVPGGSAAGSIQRRSAAQDKFGPARIEMVMKCINGGCNGAKERATRCMGGCGRSLHMLTCAQVGKGYAALGRFTCPHCVAEATVEGDVVNAVQLDLCARTMMCEMTQGAEATAGGYADFVNLCEEYATGLGRHLSAGRMVMPYRSLLALKNFATWMTFDDDRALSLVSTMIGAGTYMTKLGMTDYTKDPSFKAHLKKLGVEHGKVSTPKTAATPLMLKTAVEKTVKERFPRSIYLMLRWAIDLIVKGNGGFRNGESVGGGDLHGLLANNTSIIKAPDGKEYVELRLEHSKTGHSRYVTMAGVTEHSKIRIADTMRAFWEVTGVSTVTMPQAGFMVTRPDAWVVKVSTNGIEPSTFEEFMTWLQRPERCAAIKEHAAASCLKGRERYKAEGAGSQTKRYINIAGGKSNSLELTVAFEEIAAAGFIPRDRLSIVMAPFIRSTMGAKVTWMPLVPSSTYGTIKELLELAHADSNKVNPDPDFDLQGQLVADFSNHSLRRLADTEARKKMNVTTGGRQPVTKDEIDLWFGWHEMELSKDMQLHYATMDLATRILQSRITGLM
jgi:hypothetical protein